MTTYQPETYTESEFSEFGEFGETESEQFLGNILGGLVGGEVVSPLSEAQEYELATELLEISSEEELEQFLGGLIKKVGGFVRGPIGSAITGVLKSVARKALPMVGSALGSMVAPGIGTAIGGKLGSMASGLFEVEMESMSGEQAEFEVARRVVGLTAASARLAAQAKPRPGVSPHTIARAAVAQAARAYAPGLHRQLVQSIKSSTGASVRPGSTGAQAAPGGMPFRPGATPRPQYRNRLGATPWYAGSQAVPGVVYADGGDPGIAASAGDEPFEDNYMDTTPPQASTNGGVGTSGRWVRRGRRIVLFGA